MYTLALQVYGPNYSIRKRVSISWLRYVEYLANKLAADPAIYSKRLLVLNLDNVEVTNH